jgi:hypothetical protein
VRQICHFEMEQLINIDKIEDIMISERDGFSGRHPVLLESLTS